MSDDSHCLNGIAKGLILYVRAWSLILGVKCLSQGYAIDDSYPYIES
jgi:hypothetical protein